MDLYHYKSQKFFTKNFKASYLHKKICNKNALVSSGVRKSLPSKVSGKKGPNLSIKRVILVQFLQIEQ
jgi:hypothetical protein